MAAALHAVARLEIESLLTALINEISSSAQTGVLVLDDYHVIDAPAVHNAVAFLVDHLPPQSHLVIAGRTDPPLSLARLRARDQLIELRAADLSFTPIEAAAFLNEVMHLDLTQSRCGRVGRTHGRLDRRLADGGALAAGTRRSIGFCAGLYGQPSLRAGLFDRGSARSAKPATAGVSC